MATGDFDKLLTLTDSRYRLSLIVAKRSMQLQKGFPTLLSEDEHPENRDGISHDEVAVAIQELVLDKGITWGESLPSDAELQKTFETDRDQRLDYNPTAPIPKSPTLGI